jgi:hypothetical protein
MFIPFLALTPPSQWRTRSVSHAVCKCCIHNSTKLSPSSTPEFVNPTFRHRQVANPWMMACPVLYAPAVLFITKSCRYVRKMQESLTRHMCRAPDLLTSLLFQITLKYYQNTNLLRYVATRYMFRPHLAIFRQIIKVDVKVFSSRSTVCSKLHYATAKMFIGVLYKEAKVSLKT